MYKNDVMGKYRMIHVNILSIRSFLHTVGVLAKSLTKFEPIWCYNLITKRFRSEFSRIWNRFGAVPRRLKCWIYDLLNLRNKCGIGPIYVPQLSCYIALFATVIGCYDVVSVYNACYGLIATPIRRYYAVVYLVLLWICTPKHKI